METEQKHDSVRSIKLYNGVIMPLLGRTSIFVHICDGRSLGFKSCCFKTVLLGSKLFSFLTKN